MRRRDLFSLFGVAGLASTAGFWSTSLLAQSQSNRVGVLFPAGDSPGARTLIDALAGRGFRAGQNVTFDIRAAGRRTERLPELARELVARQPDVIVSATDIAARALTDATRDIPIVLALIGDPIALGLTKSIARPTANVTGFTTGNDTVATKRLQLLREMVPSARNVGVMWVPANAQNRLVLERINQAAAALGVEILSLPVTDDADITAAMAKAGNERVQALLIAADPLTVRNRRTIIDECLLRDLPAMHSYSLEVQDGALMSYGSDVGEDYGRAAVYVERILKGAKVAELPFQEPTHIGLAINLRTARSIGLTVPQSLLIRADTVVD